MHPTMTKGFEHFLHHLINGVDIFKFSLDVPEPGFKYHKHIGAIELLLVPEVPILMTSFLSRWKK